MKEHTNPVRIAPRNLSLAPPSRGADPADSLESIWTDLAELRDALDAMRDAQTDDDRDRTYIDALNGFRSLRRQVDDLAEILETESTAPESGTVAAGRASA